ncbi:hypothetical protein Tco_0318134 [Tanacetum coccineum]
MKDAISLMRKRESIFWLTTNEVYRPPSEPSRQEEFEHLVMNFIFDQEERIKQLEDYMQVITNEFMEFSSEVVKRLKERIKENENKPRKIEKITKYPDTKILENNVKHNFLENLMKKTFPTPSNLLCVRYFRLIPSNPSQPRKNTVGFKPGKRTKQSHHNPSDPLTVQPPTPSNPTFVNNDPIKREPSPHCSFTHLKRNRNESTRGKASSSCEESMEEKVRKFGLFDHEDHQMNYNNLVGRSIHLGDVVDWEFLSNKGLAKSFFDSINTDTFSRPQWVNLFQINEPVFRQLVRKFFASFEFNATPCRVGLYSERESRNVATLSGLRGAEMVNATRLTYFFWPSIGDGGYNVGNTKAKSIRNLRIKLAHHCITMTITGRKETTNRVTEIDLFYLYCIFREGVVCNIPYWLSKYLKSVRDKGVIFGGMKTSLVKIGVIMELHEGECCWPATRGVVEENKGDDEEGDVEGGMRELGAPRISIGT